MTERPGRPGTRHALLLAWLAENGRLDVVEAAVRLGVAPETVRRDLRILESAGRLQRVHGGAVAGDGAPPLPITALSPPTDPADRALAEQLWRELPRNGTILLGAGRLILALTHMMVSSPPETSGLTVVTHSLDAAVQLARVPTVSVYNVGGTVSPLTRAQEGDWVLEELGRFRVDLAVVCPGGVTVEYGLSHTTPAAAAVAQAVVACAERTVVLCPASMVGRSAFVRFAAVDEIESLWISGDPTAERVRPFLEHGVALRVFSSPDLAVAAEPVGDRAAI